MPHTRLPPATPPELVMKVCRAESSERVTLKAESSVGKKFTTPCFVDESASALLNKFVPPEPPTVSGNAKVYVELFAVSLTKKMIVLWPELGCGTTCALTTAVAASALPSSAILRKFFIASDPLDKID